MLFSSSRRSRSPDTVRPLLDPDSAVSTPWQRPSSPAPVEQDDDSSRNLMIAASMFSFAVIGVFVSTIGVILPFIQDYYQLNDTQVSLVFLAGPVGYVMAARLNHAIHVNLGQRGIAVIGPLVEVVAALITALHPPFPALLMSFALGGFGYGLLDGSWCAWAAVMDRANFVSGLLHGSFSAGAGFGPIMAAQLLEGGGAGVSLVEAVCLSYAFRNEDAERYIKHERLQQVGASPATKMSKIFVYGATWLCAAYLLVDVGTESAVSGWIVSFMMRIRHASPSLSSVCSSGFWGGMALGRVVLGGLTDRIGLRRGIIIYLLCAIVLQCLFVLVEGLVLSAVIITSIGFFCGPLFPSCIVQLTKALPPQLHVAAVSYVASIGQVGGALLPFGLGALSQWLGLQVFGTMIAVQLGVCLLLWIMLTSPRLTAPSNMPDGDDEEEEWN
ncbi:major facilitator superfamily domain-containing protein [Stachybotrys elegans]|uniref:Major facilitator superfamily domain-containing protein n=1 Tax=Stachybotrys elegans TaxID=80388 RepID=A0A8K0T215_9HYPO|nr:major facilitator superfamily domain-containing protein [Stachybotrys elegans]